MSAANDLFSLLNTNTNNPPALLNFFLSWSEEDTVPYGLSVPSLPPCSLFSAALKAGNYRDIKAMQ